MAHDDFDKALSIDQKNPKFWHAKGLTFQAQADELDPITAKVEWKSFIEDAIDMFDHAQETGETFYAARFH